MATTWTDISDDVLEVDKQARSIDAMALRDNHIAIAEGATGAPRIVANALAGNSVNAEKIASNAVTTAKIADRNVTGAKMAVGSVIDLELDNPVYVWIPFTATL